MLLYHGSDHIIEKPEFGAGKKHNDYGRGFYCTQNIELAKEWAVSEDADGYVNKYSIYTSKLEVLDINSDKYTMMHWLGILLKNRIFTLTTPLEREAKQYILDNFNISLDGIDIVKGYRADDSYFSYARDFISGVISYEQLSKAMRLGKLGEQYCLISKKAPEVSMLILRNGIHGKCLEICMPEKDIGIWKRNHIEGENCIFQGL